MKMFAKLMCLDRAIYEVLDEKTRTEIMNRVSWMMLEFDDQDPTEGTIWEGV